MPNMTISHQLTVYNYFMGPWEKSNLLSQGSGEDFRELLPEGQPCFDSHEITPNQG